MLKTLDIRKLFIQEINNGNVKDSGYTSNNGNKHVELRNMQFEVDKDYVFEEVPEYERMTDSWYINNYDPIALHQIDKCINKLSNPNSRQAIIFMSSETEFLNAPAMICTMYMHIFLDKISDNNYNLEYIVNMRSSDVIEFRSDIKWQKRILNIIINKLKEKYNYNIINSRIIWKADSMQLYIEQFSNIIL